MKHWTSDGNARRVSVGGSRIGLTSASTFALRQRLVCAAILVFCLTPRVFSQQEAVPVVVCRIVEREEAAGQTFVGTVTPLKTSAIGGAVDGRVVEFPVNEGDRVNKGQTLARLLTETLKIQLLSAEAELRLREHELAELENGSRPEEIAQVKAQMLAAKALLDYSKSNFERLSQLKDQLAVAENELEEAHFQAVEAENNYLQQKAAHELAVIGPRAERIAQAQARLAVQTQGVNQLKDQIKKHTIVAPFDGYVTAEHTEVGQWLGKGELVAEVIAMDEIDVEISVLEKHVAHVVKGMTCIVVVPALAGRQFPGQVALVVPQADVRSRTFPVKVRVANQTTENETLLKAGMLARVTLAVGPTSRMLMVPKDALVLGGQSPLVYVFEPSKENPLNGEIRGVPVELGIAAGSLIQLIGPLKKDQQVVVLGNERLRPGQRVVVTEVYSVESSENVAH